MEITVKFEAFLIKLPNGKRYTTINGVEHRVNEFHTTSNAILLYAENGTTAPYGDCDIAYITGKDKYGSPLFKKISASDISMDIVSGLSDEDKTYLKGRGYLQD